MTGEREKDRAAIGVIITLVSLIAGLAFILIGNNNLSTVVGLAFLIPGCIGIGMT